MSTDHNIIGALHRRPTFYFHKNYQKNLRSKSIGLNVIPDPRELGPDINALPICLDTGPNNLGYRRGCKTQVTLVCAPDTPKQLGIPFPALIFLDLERNP